jgi:hypothetical protein
LTRRLDRVVVGGAWRASGILQVVVAASLGCADLIVRLSYHVGVGEFLGFDVVLAWAGDCHHSFLFRLVREF